MKTSVYNQGEIDLLVNDLNAGFVVAIATDTVMGLAARIDNPKALEALKKVKGRSADKLFPVMVSSQRHLEKLTELKERDYKLIKQWFPGPITFVFKANPDLDYLGVSQTVAVRMPDDEILNAVVTKLDKPIFLTSANKSGFPTTKKALEVLEIFDGEIKAVLMNDALGYQASTIIDASGDDLKLIRAGKISLSDVLKSLEEEDEKDCGGK